MESIFTGIFASLGSNVETPRTIKASKLSIPCPSRMPFSGHASAEK
ncbi:MAG: hypothetical protein VX941_10195 [Pseudomonadota bacterium]|nr:hypothetical protein [Pseudomonadota bacterium]